MFKKFMLGIVISLFAFSACAGECHTKADIIETGLSVAIEYTTNDFMSVGFYDLNKEAEVAFWARLGFHAMSVDDKHTFAFGVVKNILDDRVFGYVGPLFEVTEDNFDGGVAFGAIYSLPVRGTIDHESLRLIFNLGYDRITGASFGFGGQF